MTATKRNSSAWVLAMAMLPLGLGALFLGFTDVAKGIQSQQWKPVPASVLSSGLSPRLVTPAQPAIRYQYNFDGIEHVSIQIWPGQMMDNLPLLASGAREEILGKFTAGTT